MVSSSSSQFVNSSSSQQHTLLVWSISVFPLALFFRLAMLSWLGGKAAGDVSCLTAAKKSESDKKAVALQPHELSSAKRGWHFATIMSFIECLFRLRHGRLWLTTTNLSYSFSLLETSATALCGTTGTTIAHCIAVYIGLYWCNIHSYQDIVFFSASHDWWHCFTSPSRSANQSASPGKCSSIAFWTSTLACHGNNANTHATHSDYLIYFICCRDFHSCLFTFGKVEQTPWGLQSMTSQVGIESALIDRQRSLLCKCIQMSLDVVTPCYSSTYLTRSYSFTYPTIV